MTLPADVPSWGGPPAPRRKATAYGARRGGLETEARALFAQFTTSTAFGGDVSGTYDALSISAGAVTLARIMHEWRDVNAANARLSRRGATRRDSPTETYWWYGEGGERRRKPAIADVDA